MFPPPGLISKTCVLAARGNPSQISIPATCVVDVGSGFLIESKKSQSLGLGWHVYCAIISITGINKLVMR